MTVEDQYDEFAETYDDHYATSEAKMENAIVAHIYNQHTEGGRMLDLGCGTGYFAHYFDYDEYIGVDLSQEMLDDAPELPPTEFVKSDIRSVDEGLFDSVVSTFSGLGYVSPTEAWDAVTSNLRDGGRFAVMFPSPEYLEGPYNEYELTGLKPVRQDELLESMPERLTMDSVFRFKPLDAEPPFIDVEDAEESRYIHNIVTGGT